MISFTVQSKVLMEAFNRLTKMVGSGSDTIEFGVFKDYLVLRATNELRIGIVKIAISPEAKEGQFACLKSTFQIILKGRNEISITVEGQSLAFKEARTRYNGKNIPILSDPTTPVEFPKTKEVTFDSTLQAKVLICLEAVALRSSYNDESMPIYISVKDKMLYVASADKLHAAISSIDVKKVSISDLVLPSDYAQIIMLFKADELFINFVEPSIIVQNVDTFVSLPALQLGKISLDMILVLTKSLKEPTFSAEIDCSDLKASLDNLKVAEEVGEGIVLKFDSKKDDKLALSYSTIYGSVSDALSTNKSDGKGKIKLDSRNLIDILTKINGKAVIKFYSDRSAEIEKEITNTCRVRYFITALPMEAEKPNKEK